MVAYSGSARPARSARRLNAPRPALVEGHADGTPRRVNRQDVAVVREEWRVVDRWWTDQPVHRRYFDVVLESGENAVVFYDNVFYDDVACDDVACDDVACDNVACNDIHEDGVHEDGVDRGSVQNGSAQNSSEVGRWYSQRA